MYFIEAQLKQKQRSYLPYVYFVGMKHLEEGKDFYYDKDGYMVFTAHYHLEKGFCCGHGCLHCPFDYENVPPSRRNLLLKERKHAGKENSDQ